MAIKKIGRASFIFPDSSAAVISVRSCIFEGEPCAHLTNEYSQGISIVSRAQWEQLKRVIDRGFKSMEGLKDGNGEEKV